MMQPQMQQDPQMDPQMQQQQMMMQMQQQAMAPDPLAMNPLSMRMMEPFEHPKPKNCSQEYIITQLAVINTIKMMLQMQMQSQQQPPGGPQ